MRAVFQSILERLRSWLASPHAPLGIVIASVLVVASTLANGLAADDHWQKVVLQRDPAWSGLTPPWYNLFSFYDGNAARTERIVAIGLSPWWTDPGLRVVFFRPLSAATHALDYALWPRSPWLMHAQSIAWYAALVAVGAWVYRRVLGDRHPAWTVGLAALLYGFDQNHGTPLGWLANRNAVIAALFALAALGAHDVATRGRRAPGSAGPPTLTRVWTIASAVLLALALCAGEGGLAVVGFFAAHAIFLDPRRWTARLASLAPHGFVLAGWAVLYRLGGFGVHGSGVYLEPAREPVQFTFAIAKHLPLLLATELGAPSPDIYTFLPLPGRIAIVVMCFAFIAWSSAALIRLVRADESARFLLLGSLLATLPACAVFPSGRLVTVSGWGLVGLVALVGAGVADGASWLPLPSARFARRLVVSFALWACAARIVLSPIAMQVTGRQMVILDGMLMRVGVNVPVGAGPATKRLVIMNAPDTAFVGYVLLGRMLAGEEVPHSLLTLAGGARPIEVTRPDERTVVVREESGFYRDGTELLTRNGHDPMPVGSQVSDGTCEIEVLATAPDGVPTEVAFRFPSSADAPDLIWMRWQGGVLVVTAPPRVGERLRIEGQLPTLW